MQFQSDLCPGGIVQPIQSLAEWMPLNHHVIFIHSRVSADLPDLQRAFPISLQRHSLLTAVETCTVTESNIPFIFYRTRILHVRIV